MFDQASKQKQWFYVEKIQMIDFKRSSEMFERCKVRLSLIAHNYFIISLATVCDQASRDEMYLFMLT